MKVGKFLAALVFSIIFFAGNCFAMTFPGALTEMGRIGHHYNSNPGVLSIEGIYSFDDGITKYNSNINNYNKEPVCFMNGGGKIYCIYDSSSRSIKIGGKNDYCVSLSEEDYWRIDKVDNSAKMPMYIIHAMLVAGTHKVNVIGIQKNGKWANYIDYRKLTDTYFNGKLHQNEKNGYFYSEGVSYENIARRDDYMYLKYKYMTGGRYDKVVSSGEFRFKWYEAAQWFSVEQIKY